MEKNTTTYENTLKGVMAAFEAILAKEKEMDAQATTSDYYTIQESLNDDLRAFIRMNFTYLNTRQLLKLCAMVSAYRPVQPFSFLVSCSNLINS